MSRTPSPLVAPAHPPSRYTTQGLPAYRHVPGLTPHPVRHPDGHSHGVAEPDAASRCQGLAERWRDCQEYLLGVDLFNRCYLWEAHEAWEVVWIAAGKTSAPGLFAQGLIQVSAGLLRLHLGTPRGAHHLLRKARRRLLEVQAKDGADRRAFMGLDIDDWWRSVLSFVESGGPDFPFLRLQL